MADKEFDPDRPVVENGDPTADNRDKQADQATKALVDALRVCFALLKIIMVVVIVFYLVSGVFRVQPEQVALKVRFGRVVGAELGSGLHWYLPWPVEQIICVPKGTQRSVSSAFWYQITERERIQGPGAAGRSLKPGEDNYVLTGDANILHVAMTIKYRIVDAHKFVRSIRGADQPPEPGRSKLPEQDLVVSLADRSVIRAAGQFTVDELLKQDKDPFRRRVSEYMTLALAEIDCGLGLDGVLIDRIATPRQVVRYFNEVRNAAEQSESEIKKALGDEVELLTETAGPAYHELIDAIRAEQRMLETRDNGLANARKRVSALLAQAGGTVQEILADAKIYRTQLVESAKADAEYFQALLPKLRDNPQVILTRLLLGTLEDLLGQTRKYYIQKGVKEVRIIIDRDPLELEWKTGKQTEQ